MELEDLHRVVVQGFASVSDRFDSVDARLTGLSDRIDSLDARLSGRIDSLEARLSGRIESLEAAVIHHSAEIRSLRADLTAFRHDFDHREELGRLGALETRVTAIESKLGLAR
jgi:hypothetical protein